MKINDLTTLRVFKTIYETRSLTSTAKLMGLSKPALSKRLDALEIQLGFKLFSRTTRSIAPTKEAKELIHKVNEILDKVDGLNNDLSLESQGQKIKLRVTCIASMSQRFMGKVLKAYQNKFPGVLIDLIVTDSVLDPIEHNIDLAIRVNPPRHSSLMGKKLGDYKLVAVATPDYLKKHSKVRKIEDLVNHDLLLIDQHLSAFKGQTKSLLYEFENRRNFITNDSPLISQLTLAGHGIGIRSSWDVQESIKNKQLSLVLPEGSFGAQGDIWLVSRKDRLEVESVRELYNYLLSELKSLVSIN